MIPIWCLLHIPKNTKLTYRLLSKIYCRKNAASSENKYSFIFENEVTDCAKKEQVVIIRRFVDKNKVTRDELVSFLECKNGLITAWLYKIIIKYFGSVGLDILNLNLAGTG